MTQDIWFWLFIAAYIGGGINLAIWITNGGDSFSTVPRWRIFAVCVFWPVASLYGVTQAFIEWFFKSPTT